MHTTGEQKTWTSKPSEKLEKLTELSCRSVVCGGDVFIPDSEYEGETCGIIGETETDK